MTDHDSFQQGVVAGERYARKKGNRYLCCYVEETEHPTFPTYSDHPFGEHPFLAPKVGCALCNANLNKSVRAARVELDASRPTERLTFRPNGPNGEEWSLPSAWLITPAKEEGNG